MTTSRERLAEARELLGLVKARLRYRKAAERQYKFHRNHGK